MHKHIINSSPYAFGLMLLTGLVLIWGFNWPIMKIALHSAPALWLGVIRMIMGTVCLFTILIASGKLALPSRQDLPIIISVGVLQMAAFTAFTNLGLLHVPAGRSVILAYTTPLWVTPIAMILFKEPLSLLKGCGLLLGIIGIIILFNPLSFNWHDYNVVMGNGFLILAAIAWAICIVHVRFSKWRLSPLQLMPWQLLIATLILIPFACYLEPHPTIDWSHHFIELLFYIGPIATALGYWMIIEISRRLPSITTSLCMLGVPAMGIVTAHFLLGEPISPILVASMLCIIAGLACVIKATTSKVPPISIRQAVETRLEG